MATTKPKFKAYLSPETEAQIKTWHGQTKPPISNGKLTDRLVGFGKVKGFDPKKEYSK